MDKSVHILSIATENFNKAIFNYALFLAPEIKHLISEKSVDLLDIILEKCARSLRVNCSVLREFDESRRRKGGA